MLLIEEHFTSNHHGWRDVRETDCTAGVIDGSYTFDHRRGGAQFWLSWIGVGVIDRATFRLHATIERVSGAKGSAFGIVWGVRDTDNFLEFVVREDGCARVARNEDGSIRSLIDWKPAESAHRGEGITLLEVRRARGEPVEFLINRVPFATIDAKEIASEHAATGIAVHGRVHVRAHAIVAADDTSETPTRAAKETEASYVQHTPPDDDSLTRVTDDLARLVGLEPIKRQVVRLTHLLQVQQERRRRGLANAPTTLHLVLSGPPGTGKTTLARLLGRIWRQVGVLKKGHVVETDRAGLVGGYLGQTALKVDHAVKAALDGVLFIDEAYSLVPENLTYHDYGVEAVHTLLKRMEDHRDRFAVVIAGYSREMDRFLAANPGVRSRFGRSFAFPHFTPDELVSILGLYAREAGYSLEPGADGEFKSLFEHAYARRDPAFGNARFVRNLLEKTLEQHALRVGPRVAELNDEELSRLSADDVLNAGAVSL